MTSQIVLMNKLGIAVGSDSSLTMTRGDNSRTYASAEKIFPLGPLHKVAVLHSGATEFMQHPFDILLTSWKKTLNKPLPQMEDYSDSFVSWLNHRQDLFPDEVQHTWAYQLQEDYFMVVRQNILKWLKKSEITQEQWKDESVLNGVNKILQEDLDFLSGAGDLDGLSEKWAESRYSSLVGDINDAIEFVFDDVPRDEKSDELYKEISKKILYKDFANDMDATLAFVGFGEDNIYPVHVWLRFQGVIADKPRVGKAWAKIASDSEYSLRAHGQSEAIFTFLGGQHHSFIGVAQDNLMEAFQSLRTYMDENFDTRSQEQEDVLSELQQESEKKLDESFGSHEKANFRDPFTSTLSGLPTTSLGKMAESLIHLQILRQSSTAIQDTVGGPVDVGVITLENGFQWFKHKTVENTSDSIWLK